MDLSNAIFEDIQSRDKSLRSIFLDYATALKAKPKERSEMLHDLLEAYEALQKKKDKKAS
jgi:ABC-type antimicrobial peptide transport system ATPase subunit